MALCFSILVEALKRLVESEEVNNPKLLLIVGGAGLLVNVIGLFLFHDHGRDKGGMGKKISKMKLSGNIIKSSLQIIHVIISRI